MENEVIGAGVSGIANTCCSCSLTLHRLYTVSVSLTFTPFIYIQVYFMSICGYYMVCTGFAHWEVIVPFLLLLSYIQTREARIMGRGIGGSVFKHFIISLLQEYIDNTVKTFETVHLFDLQLYIRH